MSEEEKINEEVKQEELELQIFNPRLSFKHILCEKYQGELVTVEFQCNSFMKKATGCLDLIGCDFIEVVGSRRNDVKVEIFTHSGDIIEETPRPCKIAIPLKNVCAVEKMSRRPCPCDED